MSQHNARSRTTKRERSIQVRMTEEEIALLQRITTHVHTLTGMGTHALAVRMALREYALNHGIEI